MLRVGTALASAIALFAATDARADLPAPKLIPDLTLSKDKGPDSEPAASDPWSSRPRTINLQGGAPGGPTGVAGLSFEYAPIKYVVLGTGGGWSPDGPRGAFMPRLRLPLNHRLAVGFGFPFSFGPYQFSESVREQCEYAGCSTGFRTTRTWTMAAWGHLEPNLEIRVAPAVALRLYGGFAKVLNPSDRCDSTLPNGCPSRIGEQKWYGGVALGYAW
jgi:hypothetical protein